MDVIRDAFKNRASASTKLPKTKELEEVAIPRKEICPMMLQVEAYLLKREDLWLQPKMHKDLEPVMANVYSVMLRLSSKY